MLETPLILGMSMDWLCSDTQVVNRLVSFPATAEAISAAA